MAESLSIPFMFESLQKSLGGVGRDVNTEMLQRLWDAKDYATMLGAIGAHMRVNLRLAIRMCRDKSPRGAPAWVEMPNPMPIYGSRAYKETRVIVNVSRAFLESAPFETCVFMLSHECAHIILEGIHHPLRSEERAVDLTAMILGFYEFFISGHRYTQTINHIEEVQTLNAKVRYWLTGVTETKTVAFVREYQVGYLSPEEIREGRCIIDYFKMYLAQTR